MHNENLYAMLFLVMTLAIIVLSPRDNNARKLRTSVSEIQALLDPRGVSIHHLLRSRAKPNSRLVRAFNLTNTFVSDDTSVHNTFRNAAARLLTFATRKGWCRFHQIAVQAVNHCLLQSDETIAFNTFVQAVTMMVVIKGLLNVEIDVSEMDYVDVVAIGQEITDLWRISKTGDHIPSARHTELNRKLAELIPKTEYPNPLDFIIPTWETMWRVVAIALAHVQKDEPSREAVMRLYDNPSSEQFRNSDPGVSVESIITETLRLYPPTKRITRTIMADGCMQVPSAIFRILQPTSQSTLEVADIQAVQRSAEEWGSNAHEFDPRRHDPSSQSGKPGVLMPFGYGRLACVASSWAPIAAGVIVAAISGVLDTNKYEVEAGDHIGDRDGWEGWMVSKR